MVNCTEDITNYFLYSGDQHSTITKNRQRQALHKRTTFQSVRQQFRSPGGSSLVAVSLCLFEHSISIETATGEWRSARERTKHGTGIADIDIGRLENLSVALMPTHAPAGSARTRAPRERDREPLRQARPARVRALEKEGRKQRE